MSKKKYLQYIMFLVIVAVVIIIPVRIHFQGNNSYQITQHPASDIQRMFYTITDANGDLVIIDGGHTTDADEVRSIIKEHNNHVSAWILTHPHPDHVGAFNEIMKNDENHEITIDKIYSVPYNYERYKETAQSYDEFDTCTVFDEILKEQDNVTYLKAGDTFNLIGLQAEVFSAWDENTDKFPDHLCNLGSLMFKISGKHKSMLFCADTQSEIEDGIIEKYGNELKADYVQCGHHGNWGLSTKFYDVVQPQIAFMDAPDSIVNNNNGSYDGYLLYEYFNEKGIKVYRFDGTEHTVTLD